MTIKTQNFVFPPASVPALPILGSTDLFPVHRIYCVGRNFASHAIEMGHDPSKEPPFFFQKNPDSLLLSGDDFPYPAHSSDVHYEIELVVALGADGENIRVEDAPKHVFGYGVGLDMTRRDLQEAAKKLGRPWEVGKAFEHSAPCTPLLRAEQVDISLPRTISLEVNGNLKQEGNLDQMIWKVPEIIAHLSQLFYLRTGDLIFTGTPAGVGAISRGDNLLGNIDGIGRLETRVA